MLSSELLRAKPTNRNAIPCMPQTFIVIHVGTLQVRLLPRRFPLNLIHEVKVGLIEVVHTHITIFSATAVAGSLWVDCDIVQGTEMATNTANLLHEDLVVETCLELSLTGRGGGDVHGCLSATEDNVIFHRCDRSAVQGGVRNITLQDAEILNINELRYLLVSNSQRFKALYPTLAVLSFDAVMKYDRSGAH